MPIYEYQCGGCGAEFERLQKISDPPVQICPDCGGDQVRKLVSQSGFVLKGGGWYKDHYGLKSSSGSSDGGGATESTPSTTTTDTASSGD